jgi:mannan endo-1,4-beta-mannosidase
LHGFGSKVIIGQQDERGLRRTYIAQHTGGWAPMLVGFDLLNYSAALNQPDGQIERARDWVLIHKGIATISWHWFSPFGATDKVWKSFSTDKTTFDASRVFDETSPEYAAIIKEIDGIATRLEVLRDAHVPILWRPLHEAEGGWFWWGARGPEVTKRLYRLMYDRFTRVHHLNNLLWVWTTTDNSSTRTWYPGDDVVDIIGPDIYAPPGTQGTFLAVFDNLRQLFGGRKPIALCETGTLPDPDELLRDGAPWLWCLIWDDYVTRPEFNTPGRLARIYHDNHSVAIPPLP